MAIRSTIVLTDAAATPVNHSYFPVTSGGNVMLWIDRTQGIAAGQNKLTLAQRAPKKGAPTYNMSWKLETPILAQTSPSTATGIQPVPTVDHTNLVAVNIVCHERSTTQERNDLLAQVRDLLSEAIVTNQVKDLDLVW